MRWVCPHILVCYHGDQHVVRAQRQQDQRQRLHHKTELHAAHDARPESGHNAQQDAHDVGHRHPAVALHPLRLAQHHEAVEEKEDVADDRG